MKQNEFKKILKPLIREAVKEVLFEPGVLSQVITEVTQGLNQGRIFENKATQIQEQNKEQHEEARRALEEKKRENIKRLNESVGSKSAIAGVFDDVADLPEPSRGDPLSGIQANDAGVDISKIANLAGGAKKWKTLIGK